jgi:endogenous inhibitor of DNA gyrase (YacG/DUF329 family)
MTNPTRSCATCTKPITVTSRNPNRRYCSPRCRVADWHRRHDRTHLHNAVPNDVTRHPNVVPDAVPHHDANAVPTPTTTFATTANAVPGGTNTANGEQRCPHCRQPIAVIAILVPPTAAHVRTPEVTMPPT